MTETVSLEPTEGVLSRIRYHPAGYKPVEARIAAAIIEDPDMFVRESILVLAQRISVSTGSIVRFAQSFGFNGYSALKVAVALDAPRSDAESGGVRSPFELRMDEQIRGLVAASSAIRPAEVTRAARLIAGARHVDLVATGASTSIAHSMMFALNVVGVHARHLPDSSEHAAAAAMLGVQDVLIAVSFSGRTKGTVDAAALAREAGAAVVTLTCSAKSPLLEHSDIAILLDRTAAGFAEQEWPLRTGLYAAARALTLEVADHMKPGELRRRRAKWSSGRFGIRYEAKS